ncbi:hypothetical protein [Brucella sp. 2280]|uniref:hypothetical protein n=1 Tax=Brucella sp. 2280 TaxID=2592625 RepID=UPI0012973E42|nr:hypothetical protein [Brucella sp. 2280]QGA58247.1 hypothetical protein GHC20_14430 [Brucella sp. 2280]
MSYFDNKPRKAGRHIEKALRGIGTLIRKAVPNIGNGRLDGGMKKLFDHALIRRPSMPSNEHLVLKFDICAILQRAKPDQTEETADRILSTILAALQEPSAAMVLAASALGEQSE